MFQGALAHAPTTNGRIRAILASRSTTPPGAVNRHVNQRAAMLVTLKRKGARHGGDDHGRAAATIPGTSNERPGRHLVDQASNDVVTGSGNRPFVDHDDDRADEAAGGGDGFARVGVVSEGGRKRAGVDQCAERTF